MKAKETSKPAEQTEEEVRQSLETLMQNNNILTDYNRDLVNRYMQLWRLMKKLEEDINKNGLYVMYRNGPEQTGRKRNDSVLLMHKTSEEMNSVYLIITKKCQEHQAEMQNQGRMGELYKLMQEACNIEDTELRNISFMVRGMECGLLEPQIKA